MIAQIRKQSILTNIFMTVSQLLKEKMTNESNNNTLNEKIKIEILNKDSGVTRTYKLNVNTKFKIFEDFFLSELKTKKLDCVESRKK